jgi:hypothetical protein
MAARSIEHTHKPDVHASSSPRRYSEHLLKYVFKFSALDIPSLASAFGLVKVGMVSFELLVSPRA